MFSLAYNLPKNDVKFLSIEISLKKSTWNQHGFSTIEITSKRVRGNDVDFPISEIASKK